MYNIIISFIIIRGRDDDNGYHNCADVVTITEITNILDASVIASAFAFSDIEAKITATNGAAFAKGGAIVAGDDITFTTAVGGTVFVRSNSIGIKKYDMVESEALYYIDDSTVTWQAKTGE